MPLETAEQRANEEEVVEKTTTQMYRAPEMVDLYLERELTEKVDVWVSFEWGAVWPLVLLVRCCCVGFLLCCCRPAGRMKVCLPVVYVGENGVPQTRLRRS